MSESITALQQRLRPLLAPLGGCYGGVMRLREKLYAAGIFSSWQPPAFCISVGNIGWGGTGKTPLTSWLLGWAAQRGLRPAVLTRGYRAKPKSLPYLVKPGALAEEAGDEPLMLALDHPGASIVVDPVRRRGGAWASRELHPNLYLLDDGFQHMAVGRDVNLVLLRQDDFGPGWSRVMPSGSWREGAAALERADAFLVKAGPQRFKEMADQMRSRLSSLGKPVFSFSIKPTGLRRISDGMSLPDLDGVPYLLASGVGVPGQVETTVRGFLGRGPESHQAYPDHYFFTRADVTELERMADALSCEAIICTPKDAVKIGAMATQRFWTLDLDLAFGPSLGAGRPFDSWWAPRFESLHMKHRGEMAPRRPEGYAGVNWDDDIDDFGETDDTGGNIDSDDDPKQTSTEDGRHGQA